MHWVPDFFPGDDRSVRRGWAYRTIRSLVVAAVLVVAYLIVVTGGHVIVDGLGSVWP